MTSPIPYDTHHEVVINHAKFDVCTSSRLKGVLRDRQTRRQNFPLYYRLKMKHLLSL